MSLISVDLPDEVLAEVSRLAQEFNVPRAEIFVRAVAALAARGELEGALADLRNRHAEAEGGRKALAGEVQLSREGLEKQARELAELKERFDALTRERQAAERELSLLKSGTEEEAGEKRALARELDAARRRERRMGKTLADRTYLAIRSLEVGRLRESLQRVIGHRARIEGQLEERQAAVGRLKSEGAKLARKLALLAGSRKELKESYERQRQETFKCERDIGRLRRELEKARTELKRVMSVLEGGAKLRPEPGN